MKILDRYLLRQFIQAFLICWVSLTGLYVVFDAFGNLDQFLRVSEKQGNLLSLMGRHYGYRSLFFFDRTCAVLAMIAAMFSVTWFQRHNEMTALMAAGISRRRIVKPVIAAAIVISLMAAVSREVVIPQVRDELSQDARDLLGENAQELRPRYDNESNILFRGSKTFANEQRIHRPDFLLPTSIDPKGRQLAAMDAYYQPPKEGRPGGYLFTQVSQPLDMLKEPGLTQAGKPAIITPRDQPDWLKPDECFVVSNLSFEHLTRSESWLQFASTPQLIAGLRVPSLDFGNDVRVAIHSRFVQPALDITLLFLGLPLVLARENRNMFVAIGLCVSLVGTFMVIVLSCQYLGAVYLLDPALAAWLPMMLFVPTAVALYDRVER